MPPCACARAAAKAGKSVLHLDAADHYGSHWASFQLDHFLGWARSQAAAQQSNGSVVPEEHAPLHTDGNFDTSADSRQPEQWQDVPVEPLDGLYSNVEVHSAAEAADLGSTREYNIDLAPRVRVHGGVVQHACACNAPAALRCWLSASCCMARKGKADVQTCNTAQVVHCSGSLISALLDAGANNYLEFKLVQERCAAAHIGLRCLCRRHHTGQLQPCRCTRWCMHVPS